jgi:quinol-cytochrome oxidoreductase complex cytochrome b subunit
LPFIIVVLVIFHLVLLHQVSSTTELRLKTMFSAKISFFPYFILKDLFFIVLYMFFFFVIVFFLPEIFNHSINYVPANPLVTPNHIVPEWYFLPFYAILRSILNKTFGIIAMFISMAILYLFPFIDSTNGFIMIYSNMHTYAFYIFFFNIVFLGFLGSQTAEYPCVELGLLATIIHLTYCLVYKFIYSDLSSSIFYVVSSSENLDLNIKNNSSL